MDKKEEIAIKLLDVLIDGTKNNTLTWNIAKFEEAPDAAPSFHLDRNGFGYRLEKNETRYELELKSPTLSPFYISIFGADGVDAKVVRLYNLVASRTPKLEEYMEEFIENLE